MGSFSKSRVTKNALYCAYAFFLCFFAIGVCLYFQRHENSIFFGQQLGLQSLGASGNTLASGSSNGEIIVWSISDRSIIKRIKAHDENVFSLSFSKEGKYLVSGGGDCSIAIWETNGWKLSARIKTKTMVKAVVLSPNGEIFVGTSSGEIFCWQLSTRALLKQMIEHNVQVESLAISENGRNLCSGDANGKVVVWNTMTNHKTVMQQNGAGVAKICWLGDRAIAIADEAGVLKMWDSVEFKELNTILAHSGMFQALVYDANKQWISSGGWNRRIICWANPTSQTSKAKVFTTNAAIGDLCFAGEKMIVALANGKIEMIPLD